MNEQTKAYLDDALSPEERQEFEKTLRTDPELQRQVRDFENFGQTIKQAAKPIEVKGLEQTRAALAATSRRRLPAYLSWSAGALAITLVAAAFWPTARTTVSNGQGGVLSAAPKELMEMGQSRAVDGSFAEAPTTAPEPSESVVSRSIVRTASLDIVVDDLNRKMAEAEKLVKKYQGFVDSSQIENGYGYRSAYLTLRLDSTRFDQAMRDLRGLGNVRSESTSATDVTAEIADTSARLNQMRAEEAQYLEVLKRANKVSEILHVRDYLSRVRQNIEGTEARLKVMKDQANLGTISLSLTQNVQIQPSPEPDWVGNAWIRAINRFKSAFRSLASIAINAVVLAPFWGTAALIVWYLVRRIRKS